jgi:hypothetical protein
MRQVPGVMTFPTYLIDDMHAAFDAVCVKLRLAPTTDKATEFVATKDSMIRVRSSMFVENSHGFAPFLG